MKPRILTSWRRVIPLLLLMGALLARPAPAHAHGGTGEPVALAGPLAWSFLFFGALVIAGVSLVLFSGQRGATTQTSHEEFETLTGLSGYVARIRFFSRNARLFIVHVVGMDVIYGTWLVLFNLYLLAVGFDIAFVGLRILIESIARGLTSVPAGLISDRIGRKLSFILGDGIGAAMALIAISTTDAPLLLVTAAIGGVFSALHGVAEPAFMAENSQDFERVHLFSVSAGTRTAAMIIGSALAGLLPLVVGAADATAKIEIYRTASYLGIAGWFASLIPAILLQQIAAESTERGSEQKGLFANVRHPGRIWRLTIPEALIGLGGGFVVPLMNVFFRRGVGSEEVEIGAIFSAGQAFLVVASFLAPLVAARFGKVGSVVATRALSIPFILLFAFIPNLGSEELSLLYLVGLAYIGRITLMNMAGPVRLTFAMEILDAGERGTQVGIEQAFFAGASGVTSYIGAQMMNAGDFQTPFLLMAASYTFASVLFWRFFGQRETELEVLPTGD